MKYWILMLFSLYLEVTGTEGFNLFVGRGNEGPNFRSFGLVCKHS